MSFVHLHLHSQYSLLEASCRFNEIIEKAKSEGMPAVAVTDNGNMFGAVEFYLAAKKAEVKPIIGLDVYLAAKSTPESTNACTLSFSCAPTPTAAPTNNRPCLSLVA